MNHSPHRPLKLLGTLLLLALPVCFIVAGAYCYYQPSLFSATTRFQLLYPDADAPQIQAAFHKAQREFPARAQLRLASRVSVEPSATPGQFDITAVDVDPLTTANTANTLTLYVIDSLRAAGQGDGRRVTILQKAEMSKAPSFPNVQRIMTMATSLGLLLAGAGVVLLIMNYARPT